MNPPRNKPHPLAEVAGVFLKLGCVAFGGPAAHIAMMEDEVVRRRGWLTHAEFLDLLGATNLIPGPNSTEMAIHLGHRRGGWPGLLVAGACFILPAMLIVMGFAWAYVRFGALPQAQGVLYGIKPVIIAVVGQALWKLGRTAITTALSGIVVAMAALQSLSGVNEMAVLLSAGVSIWVARGGFSWPPRGVSRAALFPPLAGAPLVAAATAGAPVAFGLWPLFLFFLKVGSVLFGSGYVLLAFLRHDLVERWHWLTESQLLDAVAVGQFTPGPVFTTATFIGYLLGGPTAGVIATVGIFLPAFLFVAISGPLIPRLRRSPAAGAFLDGVVLASLGLMAAVTWQLATAALVDWFSVSLAVVAALLLLRTKINSAWLVLGGAAAGWLAVLRGL